MKRWRAAAGEDVENPRIDAFLAEIVEVSKRHGFSLAHEDGHGDFVVEEYKEATVKWLLDAQDGTE